MLPANVSTHEAVKKLIVDAIDPWEGKRPEDSRKGLADVDQIINGIFISNDACFVEILQKNNPRQFESIVSACGYPRMQRAQPELAAVARPHVEENLKERNIKWLQIGDAVPDDKHAWTDIVFNATFPEAPSAKVDWEIPRNSKEPKHIAFREEKKKALEFLPPTEWFKPTFEVIRHGIAGKKTLLHCHGGVSRSPAVLAAFLIFEYGVTAEQAIGFLRSKRYCVDPKCRDDLKQFATSLNSAKASQAGKSPKP